MATKLMIGNSLKAYVPIDFGFEAFADDHSWYRPQTGWAAPPDPSLFTYSIDVNRTRRIVGWYPSLVMGRLLPFHSSLERDWLLLLDIQPEVQRYHPQPPTIEYRLDGKTHRYTADTVVIVQDAPIMVEVKYAEEAATPENLHRWPAIRDRFAGEGFSFKIATEEFIRAEPRLTNVQYLHLSRGCEPLAEFAFQVALALQDGIVLTLDELSQSFSDPLTARQNILGLVLRRYLATELDKPISMKSLVWLPAARTTAGR